MLALGGGAALLVAAAVAVLPVSPASVAPDPEGVDADARDPLTNTVRDGGADASPADPRCRQLSAEIAQMAERIASADPTCALSAAEVTLAFDHCAATAAGAWSLVPRRFAAHGDPAFDDGKSCERIDIEVALVHLGAPNDAGEPTRSERVPFADVPDFAEPVDAGLAANWSRVTSSWGSHSLDPPLFVDYDGDGELEVILKADSDDEGYDPSWFEIDTFRAAPGAGAHVVPYPPARGLLVDDVCDVDADGRFDLMTRGPYAAVTSLDGPGNDVPVVPAIFVQHARTDGSFSDRDEVARQALRMTCPDTPSSPPPTAGGEIEDTARELVCARLHGVSAETLRARLLPTCAALCHKTIGCERDAGAACPDWVDQVLAVPPPLQLPVKR